jgi:hypothetical protein
MRVVLLWFTVLANWGIRPPKQLGDGYATLMKTAHVGDAMETIITVGPKIWIIYPYNRESVPAEQLASSTVTLRVTF